MLALPLLITAVVNLATAQPLEARAPTAWSDYTNNAVFYPSQDATSWRTLYARTLQLSDLSILLAWEDYAPNPTLTSWPIYRSTDGGASFSPLTRVEDQVNGWGNWYQPFLYELPEQLGEYPKGTLLIAGTSTPRNLSHAYIDVYTSQDSGASWTFASHIVYGAGPEDTTDGHKAVWEPFLMMYQGQLICYYSSQTDPAHAQKLAHKVTTDLKNWSSEVNDVAEPTYGARPGMATVAHSKKSGKYILTFEYCNAPDGGGCPAHYKIASSPLEFGPVAPSLYYPDDINANPNSNPYITHVVTGSDGSGLFIMNAGSSGNVYLNTDDLDPNGWQAVDVGQDSAYSRDLRIIKTPRHSLAAGKQKLLIANGGQIGCSGSCYNYVTTGLVDIPAYNSSSAV